MTVYEVTGKSQLKEIIHVVGDACGGTMVDAKFKAFIAQLFGQYVYDKFKHDVVEDYIELQREFETEKRGITREKSERQTLNVPVALFELYVEMKGITLQEVIKDKNMFDGKVAIVAGKVRINADLMECWFHESCDNTVKHIANLFEDPSIKGTETILLVGGFSNCVLLQDAIRRSFIKKRLIIPEEAGLAVLKGAVLFGYYPLTITQRVARQTYGIRVFKAFDPAKHPKQSALL